MVNENSSGFAIL